MGRSFPRWAGLVVIGALHGIALELSAEAAYGYEGDGSGLQIALGFLAGFPLSILPFFSTIYLLGFAPPLLWAWIGWSLGRDRDGRGAGWIAPALLLVQGLGAALAPIVFGAVRSPLFHWSAKTRGALALFVVLWIVGFVEAWRFLPGSPFADGPTLGRATSRVRFGSAAIAVALVITAAGVLWARPRLEIVCISRDSSCTVTRRNWQSDTRTWPRDQLHVRPGVPFSTLEVGSGDEAVTLFRIHCSDTIVGGNFFNRCESQRGRVLADLEQFLQRPFDEVFRISDDDVEGAALMAGALMCVAVWVLIRAH